ncbi:MAG: DoxX family protein [Devosia sp.]|nr:DoxX family protein [Devosia sp.]
MTWFISFVAHLLLGGVFVVYGIRNTRHVERLSGILAKRPFPLAGSAVRIGIFLQIVGGALTVLAPFHAMLGILGGAAMIVFLVLATVLFHPVWRYKADERTPHFTATMLNSSLVGAFLLVIATAL